MTPLAAYGIGVFCGAVAMMFVTCVLMRAERNHARRRAAAIAHAAQATVRTLDDMERKLWA